MDRTCVSTGALRNQRSSSPECTDPQRWRPSRRQPPPRTGCPSCTVTQAAGRHRDGIAHFLNPASDASTLGPSRERPLMAGAVALASTGYIAAIDEKGLGGATSARPGRPGFPTGEPALPTETAREQSTRGARSSHPFGAGAGSQPSCGRRGQAVVRRTYPEELRRLARPCVLSIALPLRFYYDLPKRPPKISGVLTHRT